MSAKTDRFVVQRVQVKGKKVTVNTVRLFATVPEPKLLLLFESAVDQVPSQKFRVFDAKVASSDSTHVLLKTSADEALSDESATRFACQNETKALEIVSNLTARSAPSGPAPSPADGSAAPVGGSAAACQMCRKRKVKARVVIDGKVTLLCKACTLEQIAKAKAEADANGDGSGESGDDADAGGDEKDPHRRRHHRHHHRHHGHGHGHGKHGGGHHGKEEDAAADANERSKQPGFTVHKTEADMYAWSSSEEDGEGKSHTPRKLKVTISERSRKHKSSEKDETALEETAKSLSMRNTPVSSPIKEDGKQSPVASRRRQPRQRKEDFSVLLVPSGDGAGASTSVLDLFDLTDFGGGAALADIGDELLVPTQVAGGASTASAAPSFPNLDDLLSAPLVSATPAPVVATTLPLVVTPPTAAPVTAPTTVAPVNDEPDAASLMRQSKAALDSGDLATALAKASECVALVSDLMQTADALGKATLDSQLAYAAKYVSLLRLTKQTMAIGAPSVPSKRASALAVIAAGIRVSAEHRAKAVRAAILRCGASKDYHSAAAMLRLLLSTNPPDSATLEQQLAKCESAGETNATLPLSPTELYCAASLEPLEHGRALRCKACGLHYSLEAKMMSEPCAVCELNELESCTL